MKVSAHKRQQRHLRARRAYWASVYAQERRVPRLFEECYTEEGEIVPCPPIKWTELPRIGNLVPRLSGPDIPVFEWKPILDRFSAAVEVTKYHEH